MKHDIRSGRADLPRVVIIILNWNRRDDTIECVESVRKISYPNFEVIVVDNGSDDDSASVISRRFPDVRIIETGKNLGYAGGNNVGITAALANGAECILLLNNDTIVDSRILQAFVEASASTPNGGLFSGKVYYYSQPNRIWYAGARWFEKRSNFAHVGYQCLDTGDQFNTLEETDFAQGCALFVKVEVVKKIGLLEEQFFLNFEEIDWSYRARAAGLKCFFVPQAKVWHKISVSFGGAESPVHSYFLVRNRLFWGSRHLARNERWLMLNRVAKEIISEFWEDAPRFPVQGFRLQSAGCWLRLKREYWSLREYIRALAKSWKNPRFVAKRLGFRDYLLRRFGNQPETIRKLKPADK